MRNVRWMMTVALLMAVGAGCDREGRDGAAGGEGRDGAAAELAGPPPGELPQGVSAEQGTEGRQLYRTACVMCHGDGAEGTQLGPSLVDAEWSQGTGSFPDIIRVVTEGAPATEPFGVAMPPRGNGTFTEPQIRAVAAYTYSLARRAGAAPQPAAAPPAAPETPAPGS